MLLLLAIPWEDAKLGEEWLLLGLQYRVDSISIPSIDNLVSNIYT